VLQVPLCLRGREPGAESQTMNYVQFPVAPQLTPWVECVWRLSGHRDEAEPAQQVFPDGCLELVIHAGDAFRARIDGEVQTQPHRLVVGQMVQAVTLEPTGRVDVWGVRVHPWGARLFYDGPASHLTGRIEQASDITPALARALADTVHDNAGSDAEIAAALCRVLVRHAHAMAWPDPLCVDTATRLLAHSQGASIAQLAHATGLSSRQFERRFLAGVGLTPVTFARIARFQRVCGLLDAEPETLSAAAVACGYYDQSHLARDVRAFAGSTPSRLRADGSPLTEHFLRARRMSDFSKTAPATLA
jgi:AraC-like DNA-binding protein